jgi:hypothetical protein
MNSTKEDVLHISTIYQVWPRPGVKTATPKIINFTILVVAFLLYITMHSVFPPRAVVEKKIFENWSIFGSLYPVLKAPGGQDQ